uniref:CaMBD domain-containing protein n=1 Tax=Strongyloides papillosus TaxID=174720 RepID=A0A0N5BGH9_STREA
MHASRIDVCDLPNQKSEKKMCTKSNERVLLKGATLDDSTSPRVSRSLTDNKGVESLLRPLETGRRRADSLFIVSSDILRVSGYTNQYRHLLSGKSKRDSGSETYLNRQKSLDYDDEKRNGDIQFETPNPLDQDSLVRDTAKSSIVTRKVKRRKSGYGIAITSDSTAKMRFRHRKLLFEKRNHVCDLSLVLALVGLVLVVIDSEMTALNVISKSHLISYGLRAGCVLSTFFLLISLITYHRIEVHLALIDSGADDWRVALTTERIIKLGIELIVCACCPFPGSGTIRWPHISPIDRNVTMVQVPTDVVLSVPMFLRAYLLCRFMVLHSKQFQDAATRSIAALNRISMDFRFVIKTMMANHPLRVLVVFTCAYWTCMSWMFTQCERYNNLEPGHEHYYLNSLWFIMVTFMSIGYGDIVPTTYCGRMLSITTGIVGAGVSSALIAVISRKLELSRAEKHVNNFMADSKLTNQRKNAAASVLQQTWFIHKYQKGLSKGDDLRLRHHQRKFLQSIYEFRKIKWDQRKLQEKGNSLLDVGKLHSEMHETLWEMHRAQDQFISQIDMLTQKVAELQVTIMKQIDSQKGKESAINGGVTSLTVPENSTVYCMTNSVTTPDCSRTSSMNASPKVIHRIHSHPYIKMDKSLSNSNLVSNSQNNNKSKVIEIYETGETTSLLQ